MSETEHEQDEPLVDDEPESEPDEAEQGEDEEDPAAEPEPIEASQPEPPQDEDRERLAKSLSTRYESYKKSMIDKLGDESPEWMVCPLCTSSMAPGFVNVHDFGNVPEEIRTNVNTYFGLARETEYPSARGINVCDDCSGLGKVATGSRVAEHMTITCPTCKGYGYTPPPGASGLHSVAVGNGSHENAEALADLDQPERDAWGEPKVLPDGTLNGNYGKMPQFKSVHPVYGVTANLSPEELVTG